MIRRIIKQHGRWTTLVMLQLPSPEDPVIVVGGGLAGLSAALEAIQERANVVLIEGEKNLGGNSQKVSTSDSDFYSCCEQICNSRKKFSVPRLFPVCSKLLGSMYLLQTYMHFLNLLVFKTVRRISRLHFLNIWVLRTVRRISRHRAALLHVILRHNEWDIYTIHLIFFILTRWTQATKKMIEVWSTLLSVSKGTSLGYYELLL